MHPLIETQIRNFVMGSDLQVSSLAGEHQKATALIEQCVQQLWPGTVVRPFGSSVSTLATTGSDVDVVVMNAPKGGFGVASELEKMLLAQKGISSSLGVKRCDKGFYMWQLQFATENPKSTALNVDVVIIDDTTETAFRAPWLCRYACPNLALA